MQEVNDQKHKKHVVMIWAMAGDLVLMQLRDDKVGIEAPGCWSVFGGSIAPGESPSEAAERELHEEIGYKAKSFHFMGIEGAFGLPHVVVHCFSCALNIPIEEIMITEGIECKLVSLEQVQKQKIYSEKLKEYRPLTQDALLEKMLIKTLAEKPYLKS